MWRRFDLYSASQPFSLVSRIPDQKTPAGVVDQDRHRPELGGGLRQRGIHRSTVAHVDGDTQRTDLRRGGRARRGVAFPDRHLRTERLETRRDAAADARAAAGDNRDAVGEKDA